jgi:hypothetical protein
MIEKYLAVPFETVVLGVPISVERVDLPLPTPLPDRAEWIEAYRRWHAEGHRPGRPK